MQARPQGGNTGDRAEVARPVARVVSVNVGEPRTVEWHGRQVRTAIWKEPVEGRVAFGGVNLVGDDQADRRVHGGPDKAVYAYAAEDYEWWRSELGLPMAPGTFGENLTTSGLDLASAVLGERWRLGTGAMRVAQPRQPCFKLGIRMGDAGFPERFEQAGRFGAYLRIDEPGDVGAGDHVRLESRPVHGVTLAMVAEAAATRQHRLVVGLLDAGADLPQGWRTWAERQLERPGGAAGVPPPDLRQ